MKRKIQITLGFIFLAAFLFILLVLIKPGFSYFYKKSQIQPQNISRVGNAYQYQFNVNTDIYNPKSILILEDQKVLKLFSYEYTQSGEKGSFALKGIDEDQITILFVPTTPSDPASNGHTYSIDIRPYFISSSWAWNSLVLLFLLIIISYFWPGLADPPKLKSFLGWPAVAARQLHKAVVRPKSITLPSKSLVIHAVVTTTLVAFLYVFMEWLFFVTKPSYMDMFAFGEKVNILLISGLIVALILLATLLAMFLLDILLTPFFPSFRSYIYYLPAAFMATCLCLIMFDNFTYTVFKFGIVDTRSMIRGLYTLGFTALLIYLLRVMAAATKPDLEQGSYRYNSIAALSLFAVSCILAGFTFKPLTGTLTQSRQNVSITNQPNIILFNTDGVNALNLSVYGYQRDTTPFITELAKSSLIGENNFTNGHDSASSETATLTGKLPFSTHVLNPSDTLQGVAEYQSLPALLKINGYRTVSLAVPVYVDPNAVNLKRAFDAVNCKSNSTDSLLSAYNYDNEIYLLTTIQERIGDRLQHIFFIQDMSNPYQLVTEADSAEDTDEQKIDCLHGYLENAAQTGQPLFAHVHLMGTHGPTFAPSIQVFSKGEKQTKKWMTDFYDDSILNYDSQVQALVQYLKDHGQWNNTILILYTDHGQQWLTRNRLPLIIHFPNDQHAGATTENTQNIDIAPTLLDYLDIQIPTWMEGNSLLGKLDTNWLIIAGMINKASVIQCQNWYIFNFMDGTVNQGSGCELFEPM